MEDKVVYITRERARENKEWNIKRRKTRLSFMSPVSKETRE
jgi:hypothetical protein